MWFIKTKPLPPLILTQGQAVLLIDMQKNFVPNIRKGRADVIISKQLQILHDCVKKDIPVIVLELSGYGKTIAELTDVVSQVPRHVFLQKEYNSGFSDTNIDYRLRVLEVSELVLMGINAQYCVKATAKSALQHGYSIVTSPDLISGQKHHEKHDDHKWFKNNGSLVTV